MCFLHSISHFLIVYGTAVHKAYKMLEEDEQKGYVLEMVEDAKAKLDMEVYTLFYIQKIYT